MLLLKSLPTMAVIYLLWDCLYADLVNIWKLDFEGGLGAWESWDVLWKGIQELK